MWNKCTISMDYFQKNAQPYFCFEAKKYIRLKNCQLSNYPWIV